MFFLFVSTALSRREQRAEVEEGHLLTDNEVWGGRLCLFDLLAMFSEHSRSGPMNRRS